MLRRDFTELLPERRSPGYVQLLALVDSIRDGKVERPPGFFSLSSSKDPFIQLVELSSFRLAGSQLQVLTLPPVPFKKPVVGDMSDVASLVLLRYKGGLAFRLKHLASRERGYILNPPAPTPVRLPPGIHSVAALRVTRRMKVKTVSGGLPSLGKRK